MQVPTLEHESRTGAGRGRVLDDRDSRVSAKVRVLLKKWFTDELCIATGGQAFFCSWKFDLSSMHLHIRYVIYESANTAISDPVSCLKAPRVC